MGKRAGLASPEEVGGQFFGAALSQGGRGAPLMLTLYRLVTISGGRGRMLRSIRAIPACRRGNDSDSGVSRRTFSFARRVRRGLGAAPHRPDAVAVDEGPYEPW